MAFGSKNIQSSENLSERSDSKNMKHARAMPLPRREDAATSPRKERGEVKNYFGTAITISVNG